ncbi:hemolysin family protein [Halorubrum sp. DTA98]|uniref:hemolysin family protein n=1 Tax=Halorubrum sp. DTA98 TaxID=3402163 RepID=UPI003AAE9E28
MVDVALSASRLLVALGLVVLNGFFVASEFAFVRIRSTSVERLSEEGRAGSDTLQEVVANLDDYLAVTQLGITLASLGLGWVGEPAVASLIEPVLESVLPPNLIHLVAFGIGFGFITFLHVVFGELAPKTIAIAQAERISLLVAPPMKAFYYLFYPGLVVFNGTANAFTRLLGVPPASETDETLEEPEIRRVLARAGEEGNVDAAEVEMIERVFELDDIDVRSILVPRPDVVSVPADASLAAIRSTVLEAGHTRYPVVEPDNGDLVVGFIDVKDVLRATETLDGEGSTARELAHEIIVVPETTAANELLLQFREERQQMAAVIDEWGAFEGIATVEDVVEAIVGDLRDEFDVAADEPTVRRLDGERYDVDGDVSLGVVSDVLGVELVSEGFETIGGFVLDRLGRAPEVGDSVEVAGYVIEVTTVDGTRVSTLRVRETDDRDEPTSA